MNIDFAPLKFMNDKLYVLDQRELPHQEIFLEYDSMDGAIDSIKEMVVRGAPCIGFTGIYAFALYLKTNNYSEGALRKAAKMIIEARPTAVNLAFEVERALSLALNALAEGQNPYLEVVNFAHEQIRLSEANNRAMANFAQDELIKIYGNKKFNILTHCNTGFLACGSIGTALGVVQNLAENNLIKHVWVDETRPYLQGSRLTAYELTKLSISHDIVVEGAASYLMSKGLVDAIYVGADRIAANGDTANKIGTANLSIIAKYFNVPFYVVAPLSTFDIKTESGDKIEIELRSQQEILEYKGVRIAPLTSTAFNPSFDVSLGQNISGIICEKGLLKPPYIASIRGVLNE
jgi:methylthioribose-1-phosphate isomerase